MERHSGSRVVEGVCPQLYKFYLDEAEVKCKGGGPQRTVRSWGKERVGASRKSLGIETLDPTRVPRNGVEGCILPVLSTQGQELPLTGLSQAEMKGVEMVQTPEYDPLSLPHQTPPRLETIPRGPRMHFNGSHPLLPVFVSKEIQAKLNDPSCKSQFQH